MFGKRSGTIEAGASGASRAGSRAAPTPAPAPPAPQPAAAPPPADARRKPAARRFPPTGSARRWSPRRPPTRAPLAVNTCRAVDSRRSEAYYETKGVIFGALIEAIDLAQLARLDADSAREEIRDIVNEIIAIKNIVMSISEQEELLDDICNDVLGFGPLEPLLSRDDIADIMVNGSGTVYIEVHGKIQKTGIRFRDNQQLLNICQRIVSQIGRRVDESSPICDARLPDGSRVNAIVPPLAIDGPALTIRKFKKDKLTLDQLVKFGTITQQGAEILRIIGRCRVNTLVSGGTGSGKTTLLNCLTQFIDDDERIITCEDAAELQLQQPHVVRLETRPPNLEGEGQVTMRDLVRNCLRMRPERIIVGEVRGPEAFDLLQAMNTGHDGSMGTLHANNPREALSRLESMITMGGFSLPSRTIREMIVASVDVVIQAARLRDGSRKITHITEVMGMEGDVIITQDLFVYDMIGRGRATATSSAATARPASAGRASGIAPATTAKRSVWPPRSTPPKPPTKPCGPEPGQPCKSIAMFFLAAVAVGGVAWVFVYPILSGERKAEQRMASVAKAEPAARTARGPQKSRRDVVEATLKEFEERHKKSKQRAALGAHRAGRPHAGRSGNSMLISAGIGVGDVSARPVHRRRPHRRRRARLCRRLRLAALAAVLFEEAARERNSSTRFPTRSTSSCAASRPACRCSTA